MLFFECEDGESDGNDVTIVGYERQFKNWQKEEIIDGGGGGRRKVR